MVSVWGLTDKGIVRRENQDSCAYETIPERGLACGRGLRRHGRGQGGGHRQQAGGGDLPHPSGRPARPRLPWRDAESCSWPLRRHANRVVYHKASTDDACIGMGTTLVGLILQGETLEVVNVGDSRAYRIRPDGIRRITRDHSVVEDLIANGDLTPEQARRHPQKNLITRALGTSPPRESGPLPGDRCAGGCAPAVLRRSHQRGHRSGDPKGSPGRRLPPRDLPAAGGPHPGPRSAGQRHRRAVPAVRRRCVAMDQYIGKMLDNRYEILDVIGVGGMAVVYKAYCHRLHRFVAIKVLKKDLASGRRVPPPLPRGGPGRCHAVPPQHRLRLRREQGRMTWTISSWSSSTALP